MKTKILANRLKAALLFACRDESRHSICGVWLEVVAGKPAVLVATDGRRLFACAANEDSQPEPESFSLLLEAQLCKELIQFAKEYSKGTTIHVTVGAWKEDPAPILNCEAVFSFLITGRELRAKISHTNFTKWREIIPVKEEDKSGIRSHAFHPEYMVDFRKAQDLITGKETGAVQLLFSKDGLGPIQVLPHNPDTFLGIVMPMRLANDSLSQPLPKFL